jgi:tetratricopeptide (TPR) repeat protein
MAATQPAVQPSPASFPSDFPAILGNLDEPDIPLRSKTEPAFGSPASEPPDSLELDLPVVADDLPALSSSDAPRGPLAASEIELDLPDVVEAGLPVASASADLPIVAAGLPVPGAGLPVVSAGLPVSAGSRPRARHEAQPRAGEFGEMDLPNPAETLPTVVGASAHLPSPAETLPAVMHAGAHLPDPAELLPTAGRAVSTAPVAAGSGHDSGHFGEIELPEEAGARRASEPPSAGPDLVPGTRAPDAASHPSHVRRELSATASGGMSFGEVDLAGSEAGADKDISVVGALPKARAAEAPSATDSAAEETFFAPPPPSPLPAVGSLPARRRPAASMRRRRPLRPRILLGLVVLAILGGFALELTPCGAFGYLIASDWLHAGAYERATLATVRDVEKRLGADTYDAARSAVDAAAAAHATLPRAKPLTAYAALVDFAASVRFGVDAQRRPRGKQLLEELPAKESVRYRGVAGAAQIAESGDVQRALGALAAADGIVRGDPVEIEASVLLGYVDLAAKDGTSALSAFRRAIGLAGDARSHFGLARAYDLLGDAANAAKEVAATLASSPDHPGALTLRARLTASDDEERAVRDLDRVLVGSSRAKASPTELSRAYALRARIDMRRGSTSEAREAYAQALHLDPRDIEALCGEGRLFLSESRPTEALSRFDAALQIDPTAVDAIVGDAAAKMAAERPADAKQQLLDARTRYPKDADVALLLGTVEERIGSKENAEADYRSAIGLIDPKRPDAVAPYVALSELYLARGDYSDAMATLDDARRRLSASVALDCALGEVAEQQGKFTEAVGRFRAAVARDPRGAMPRFRLAVALRKAHQLAEARTELDHVAAVDADYPGLMLERGQLLEDLGQITEAVEQFQLALAKAPDDPDLQLRVGSVLVAVGRTDEALAMLRKVLEKRPTNAEAHHYIGRALMDQGPGHEVEALRYLKRAVDLDANRAEYHVYVAWVANEIMPPQLELVRDEVERALAVDQRNPEAYWQRGVLERMQGAVDDAVRDEKHALELRPSRYEAHAVLAECYEDKNSDAAAAAEWQAALAGERAPAPDVAPHPYWRYKLGRLYYEHGNSGAALPLLLAAANALEHQTTRPGWRASLYFMTAEALRKSGRNADALAWYRRFFDVAPVNSPDRLDAQTAIARITGAGGR